MGYTLANSVAQAGSASNTKAQVWDNGNGGGSEKWDLFEETARFATSQKDFN